MKTNVICTECPMGCSVTVEHEGARILGVTGNGCLRGKQYASDEVVCPRRTVTSTVRTSDGRLVSVKTNAGIPKTELEDAMQKIAAVRAETPVSIGDVLLQGISEGVDLVATAALGAH